MKNPPHGDSRAMGNGDDGAVSCNDTKPARQIDKPMEIDMETKLNPTERRHAEPIPIEGWIARKAGRNSFFYFCHPCRNWHGHGFDGRPWNLTRCPHCPSLHSYARARGEHVEIVMKPIGEAPKEILKALKTHQAPPGETQYGEILEPAAMQAHLVREIGAIVERIRAAKEFEDRRILDDIERSLEVELLTLKIWRALFNRLIGAVRRRDVGAIYADIRENGRSVDEAVDILFPYTARPQARRPMAAAS